MNHLKSALFPCILILAASDTKTCTASPPEETSSQTTMWGTIVNHIQYLPSALQGVWSRTTWLSFVPVLLAGVFYGILRLNALLFWKENQTTLVNSCILSEVCLFLFWGAMWWWKPQWIKKGIKEWTNFSSRTKETWRWPWAIEEPDGVETDYQDYGACWSPLLVSAAGILFFQFCVLWYSGTFTSWSSLRKHTWKGKSLLLCQACTLPLYLWTYHNAMVLFTPPV